MANIKETYTTSLSNKSVRRFKKIGGNVLLVIYSLFALFPLFWMILISFKADAQMFTTTFAFDPTLSNYEAVLLNSNYFKYFVDSLIVSLGAVGVSVAAGVPMAYALARFNFKNKEGWAFQILSFKFAPEILVVLPLFLIFQKIGLYDTYFGLIWVFQLITLPFLIWVVRGYFEDISVEIEYAGRVDGYSWGKIFIKILLPLIRPGLVASTLLAFIFAWNSFTFPLQLSGTNVEPVTVAALKYLASDTVHYGQMAVAATVSALPAIVFAIIIQKHLVRGLSFGAVKG